VHYEVLSNDRMSGFTRSFTALKHGQNLGGGFGLGLNLNRVSDIAYFQDLSTTVVGTSQENLLRSGVLTYGAGWWSALARVQRFQVLHTAEQYRSQPQVALNAQRTWSDANVAVISEYADFRHNTLVNGERVVVYPSVSYPLLRDLGYYLTPKIGVHRTQYQMGLNNTNAIPDATRTVPIFSVDGGMVFERDDALLGTGYVQTLEPRLFYVYVPYRDQSLLPNFDSAQAPFNFGQIFTENRFIGNDRIGDANMATAAITTRFIDNEGGIERLRVTMAERFSFKAPQVNFVTPADNTNRSDILLGLSGRLTRAWSLDSLFQYNPNQVRTESYNVMARYKPEAGKLLNLGYRFDRNQFPRLRQTDVSTQWPVFGRWQGVARLNYSLEEKRVVEALSGLEYNQACWTVRIVAQSFTSATRERNNNYFLQLELNDLVPIGSDPLTALRNSIFGYTKMNSLPAEQPAPGLR
jgi:LPS-assembly protein